MGNYPEEYVAASVDVIGIAPGQTQPVDAIKAINAMYSLDPHIEAVWVMIDGKKYAIDRVELVHGPDRAYRAIHGTEAECNEIRLHLGS